MNWPKQVWKVNIPMKVSFFVWLVIRKACLTQDKLQRRALQICSKCFLCEKEGEINEHLFLHCISTINLWHMFFCILRITWVIPSSTLALLSNWWSIGNRGGEEDWWKIIPACIWWTVWKERNGRHFEGTSSFIEKIRMNCLSLFFF